MEPTILQRIFKLAEATPSQTMSKVASIARRLASAETPVSKASFTTAQLDDLTAEQQETVVKLLECVPADAPAAV